MNLYFMASQAIGARRAAEGRRWRLEPDALVVFVWPYAPYTFESFPSLAYVHATINICLRRVADP